MTEYTRSFLERYVQYTRNIRLSLNGGYPAIVDGKSVDGFLIVADVEHDGYSPRLDIYDWDDIEMWWIEASAVLAPQLAECVEFDGSPDETLQFELIWELYNNGFLQSITE